MQTKPLLLILAILSVSFAARADDQQAASAETRMRQALRDTMLQLRDAQNQVVTLQAAKDQGDKDKADLQAKFDALSAQLKTVSDQAAADKTASDKAIEEFKTQVADQTGQIKLLNEGLKQWKDAYNQAAQLAATKDAEGKQLAMQSALLKRDVEDREMKNLALYRLGSEILKRYEQFGLGDAIAAKEPFVGLSRVKLENLVQDYKNKLLDQAITTTKPSAGNPEQPAEPASSPSEPLPNDPTPAKPAQPSTAAR